MNYKQELELRAQEFDNHARAVKETMRKLTFGGIDWDKIEPYQIPAVEKLIKLRFNQYMAEDLENETAIIKSSGGEK